MLNTLDHVGSKIRLIYQFIRARIHEFLSYHTYTHRITGKALIWGERDSNMT